MKSQRTNSICTVILALALCGPVSASAFGKSDRAFNFCKKALVVFAAGIVGFTLPPIWYRAERYYHHQSIRNAEDVLDKRVENFSYDGNLKEACILAAKQFMGISQSLRPDYNPWADGQMGTVMEILRLNGEIDIPKGFMLPAGTNLGRYTLSSPVYLKFPFRVPAGVPVIGGVSGWEISKGGETELADYWGSHSRQAWDEISGKLGNVLFKKAKEADRETSLRSLLDREYRAAKDSLGQ